MKSSKGSAATTIIIIVLALIIVAGGIWYFVINKPKANSSITDDQLKDWKTYTNKEYGFEIKYPDIFTTDGHSTSDSYVVQFLKNSEKTIYGQIEIAATIDEKGAITEFTKNTNWTKIGTKMIGDRSFQEFKTKDEAVAYISYIKCGEYCKALSFDPAIEISFNGTALKLMHKNTEEIINQILSTFKFINQDTTVDWKTYTNNQYGFLFKAPQNYKFDPKTDLNVLEFSKLPRTIQEACDKEKAGGGQSYDSNGNLLPSDCKFRLTSQEELLSFSQQIKNLNVGQSISIPGIFHRIGKVITLDVDRGILELGKDEQGVGTHVTLSWLDKFNNLITINRSLEPNTVDGATKTADYNTFLQIISTFKFTK